MFPNYVDFIHKVDGLEVNGSNCMWPILRETGSEFIARSGMESRRETDGKWSLYCRV